jgi:hypothetical protein
MRGSGTSKMLWREVFFKVGGGLGGGEAGGTPTLLRGLCSRRLGLGGGRCGFGGVGF